MINKITGIEQLTVARLSRPLLFLLIGITLLSIAYSISFNNYWGFLLPFGVLMLFLTIVNFKVVYFLLFAFIPLSTEVTFKNGFSTDIPTEPLIIYLMFVYIIYVLANMKNISNSFFKHPLTLLIFFHLLWITITSISSHNPLVSFKFLLAKIWYVITFYFLASLVMQKVKDLKVLFWATFIPLFIVVTIVLIRHSQYYFDFEHVNSVFTPFFRNHVNYACILALLFPYIFLSIFWYKRWSNKWLFLIFSVVYIFIAIQLSYTRAAVVAIFIAIAAYFVIQHRLIKPALVLVGILFGLFIALLSYRNNYLEYAPNFEKTVTHRSFEDLLESTYKLEDISTMERVYRWVAGTQMIKESPWIGFGPGNFYNYYKSYTVSSFRTYVSVNTERSGIHCYYLMTFTEQGLPGLVIFLCIILFALIKGEQTYLKLRDKGDKNMLMAAMLSLIIILTLLLINDMIETDKVGPFFFLALAIIANADIKVKRQESVNERILDINQDEIQKS